jgi:uncharacterized protein
MNTISPNPLISITFHPELKSFINNLVKEKILSSVEFVPDSVFSNGLDFWQDSATLYETIQEIGLPYTFHLVDNSLLSADFRQNNPGTEYYERLRCFSPFLVSEHMSCSRIGDLNLGANIPSIYSPESLEAAVQNVSIFKDLANLKSPFLLEHIPTYIRAKASTMHWTDFYLEWIKRTKSNFLLDLNNLYCEEVNHGFDVESFLNRIPEDRVLEVHVAGGSHNKLWKAYLDGHDSNIPDRVFELLKITVKRFNPMVVNLERESNFDDLPKLYEEIIKIKDICHLK